MKILTDTHIVLFDIDGTLVSSQKSELDERQRYTDTILEVTGIKPQVDPSRFAGMVDPQICKIILTETGIGGTELEIYLPKVLARMALKYKEMSKKVRLNHGVKDLLEVLSHSTSHILGVLTGNLASIGREKLAAAGISQYFKEGFYADNYEDRNRLVEDAVRTCVSRYTLKNSRDVIIIGDTPLDVKAAKTASATPIGVASGVFSMRSLSISGAAMTFPDLTPSKELLSSLSFQNLC